jgi:imidazolonepropionase-like amidohydrolase
MHGLRGKASLPALALVLMVGCGGDEVRTVPDNKKTDSGSPAADSGSPAADSGSPAADSGSPTADSGSPTADSGSRPADSGPSGPKITICRTLDPLPTGTCEVEPGGASKLLTGTILTPEHVFRGGEMLVTDAGVISCVGCDCSAQATGATRIRCPKGVISPGLVNTHDHLTFSQNVPYTDTGERYEQRHDWRLGLRGHTKITSTGSATTSQIQWGELRFVMGGATSTAGAGSASGFLRNLDSANQEGLTNRPVQLATFPLDDAPGTQRDGDCNYGANASTQASIAAEEAFEPHVAEGIDAFARNEFLCTSSSTYDTIAPGVSNDLLEPKSAFIHAVGLRAADYRQMATEGAALVWSPRSNLALYGNTANVTVAARVGVRIALGTDWVVTGSMNLLRELHCADTFNEDYLGGFFTDEDLWKMVTVNAANAVARADTLGVLAPGHVADIAIFDGASRADYRAVIDVCGREKRVCAQAETGLAFDALQAAAATPYPAFSCGLPANEPSCTPLRSASVSSSTIYTGVKTADDEDGDGIPSASDDCPTVFNPVRPVDDGAQADADGDGNGDACDPCPLDASTTSCAAADR